MESLPWNAPSGLEACIAAFLVEHPHIAQESNRASQASNVEDLWLTPAHAALFAEWAQRMGYLPSVDAQRLITETRQLADTIYNRSQQGAES